MEKDEHSTQAASQIRKEIHAVIRRFSSESDVTLYQVIGALRMVEHDLVEMIDKNGAD